MFGGCDVEADALGVEGEATDSRGGQLDAAHRHLGEGLKVKDANRPISRGRGQQEDRGVVGDTRHWRCVARQLCQQLSCRQVPDLSTQKATDYCSAISWSADFHTSQTLGSTTPVETPPCRYLCGDLRCNIHEEA